MKAKKSLQDIMSMKMAKKPVNMSNIEEAILDEMINYPQNFKWSGGQEETKRMITHINKDYGLTIWTIEDQENSDIRFGQIEEVFNISILDFNEVQLKIAAAALSNILNNMYEPENDEYLVLVLQALEKEPEGFEFSADGKNSMMIVDKGKNIIIWCEDDEEMKAITGQLVSVGIDDKQFSGTFLNRAKTATLGIVENLLSDSDQEIKQRRNFSGYLYSLGRNQLKNLMKGIGFSVSFINRTNIQIVEELLKILRPEDIKKIRESKIYTQFQSGEVAVLDMNEKQFESENQQSRQISSKEVNEAWNNYVKSLPSPIESRQHQTKVHVVVQAMYEDSYNYGENLTMVIDRLRRDTNEPDIEFKLHVTVSHEGRMTTVIQYDYTK